METYRELDELAISFMRCTLPTIPIASLDEWLHENHDNLTQDERQKAMDILSLYDD